MNHALEAARKAADEIAPRSTSSPFSGNAALNDRVSQQNDWNDKVTLIIQSAIDAALKDFQSQLDVINEIAIGNVAKLDAEVAERDKRIAELEKELSLLK